MKVDKALIISELQKHKKFSKNTEFANFLGIPDANLRRWKERNTYNIDLLVEKFPEINPEWLLTGKGEMLKSRVASSEQGSNNQIISINPESPKSNTLIADVQASAGFGLIADKPTELEKLPNIFIPNAPYGLNIAFQIEGDSMHPTIRHLDYVAGNKIEDIGLIRDGYAYIIIDVDTGVSCKRVYHLGNDWQIVSDNPTYKPYNRKKNEILGFYRAFARLSFDFHNYQDDIRSDVAKLRGELEDIKKKMK